MKSRRPVNVIVRQQVACVGKPETSLTTMGAFNTVKAEVSCPYCSSTQLWTIQFKYGNCWQFEYEIGRKLRWGGNKKGQNVGGNVRTPGIAEEPCGKCGKTSLDAVVYFRDNIIERVELIKAPLNLKGYFEIL